VIDESPVKITNIVPNGLDIPDFLPFRLLSVENILQFLHQCGKNERKRNFITAGKQVVQVAG
jgi:hypothetical protein